MVKFVSLSSKITFASLVSKHDKGLRLLRKKIAEGCVCDSTLCAKKKSTHDFFYFLRELSRHLHEVFLKIPQSWSLQGVSVHFTYTHGHKTQVNILTEKRAETFLPLWLFLQKHLEKRLYANCAIKNWGSLTGYPLV